MKRRQLFLSGAALGVTAVTAASAAGCKSFFERYFSTISSVPTNVPVVTPVPAYTSVPPTATAVPAVSSSLTSELKFYASGVPIDKPYDTIELFDRSGNVLDRFAVAVKPGTNIFDVMLSPDRYASLSGQEIAVRLTGYDYKSGSALEELVASAFVPVPVPFVPVNLNGRTLEQVYASGVNSAVSFGEFVEINKVYGFVGDDGKIVGSDVLVSAGVAAVPAPVVKATATSVPAPKVGTAGFAAGLLGVLQLNVDASGLPDKSTFSVALSDGAAPVYGTKFEPISGAVNEGIELDGESFAALSRFAGRELDVSYGIAAGNNNAEVKGRISVPFGSQVLYPFAVDGFGVEEIYNNALYNVKDGKTMGYDAWLGLNKAAGFMDKGGNLTGGFVLVPNNFFEAVNGRATGYVAVPQKATATPTPKPTPATAAELCKHYGSATKKQLDDPANDNLLVLPVRCGDLESMLEPVKGFNGHIHLNYDVAPNSDVTAPFDGKVEYLRWTPAGANKTAVTISVTNSSGLICKTNIFDGQTVPALGFQQASRGRVIGHYGGKFPDTEQTRDLGCAGKSADIKLFIEGVGSPDISQPCNWVGCNGPVFLPSGYVVGK